MYDNTVSRKQSTNMIKKKIALNKLYPLRIVRLCKTLGDLGNDQKNCSIWKEERSYTDRYGSRMLPSSPEKNVFNLFIVMKILLVFVIVLLLCVILSNYFYIHCLNRK